MALDPRIILAQRPVQVASPYQIQQRGQQIQQNQQQLAADQMRLEQAQQANADASVQRQALQQGGGLRDRTNAWLQQNGHADQIPVLAKYFDEADAAAGKAKKARQDAETAEIEYFGRLALYGKEHPDAIPMLLQHAKENEHDTRQFEELLGQNPQAVGQVLDAIIARAGFTPKGGTTEQAFTLTPGSKRFNADGSVLAEVPITEKPASAQGFTLAPGAKRYDADGNLIASAPDRPPGASGSERLVAIMGPDGKPVLVPQSQAAGKQPASSGEQGRAVTSGDANRMADFDTALNDLATLTREIPAGSTGTAAKVGASLPNFITEWTGAGATAKSKQAVIDRVKQVIGKALEGGVLRKEDEYKYAKILPTIGDVDSVVAAKLQGLDAAIRQRKATTLDNLEDAGYDTGRFRERETSVRDAEGWKDAGGGIRVRKKAK